MSETNQNVLFENEGPQGPQHNQAPAAPASQTPAPAAQRPCAEAPASPEGKTASDEGKPVSRRRASAKKTGKDDDFQEGASDVAENIHAQLFFIQQNLKVGKDNINSLGGRNDSFAYRTLEDIYVMLKPLLAKVNCTLVVPVQASVLGSQLVVTATAHLENAAGEFREVTDSAVVNLSGNGCKYPSQETLSSGTMARKAAISGLFLLDNTRKEDQEELAPTEIDSQARPVQQAQPQASPSNQPADPAPEVPETPAGSRKKVLEEGSPAYQKLGIKAVNFKGSEDQLVAQLRLHYEVSDNVAAAFVADFYRGDQ